MTAACNAYETETLPAAVDKATTQRHFRKEPHCEQSGQSRKPRPCRRFASLRGTKQSRKETQVKVNHKFISLHSKPHIIMNTDKKGYVYILFNRRNGTLYTGVTSFLKRRVYEHKTKFHPDSFTAKYSVDKLGYYEEYVSIKEAIEREKQIKAGSRAAKLALIEGMNPDWEDLYNLL